MTCRRCFGTGKYFGLGMMLTTCNCGELKKFGASKESETETIERSKIPIDRRSAEYRKAVNDIMKLYPDMSRREASDLFDKKFAEG